MKKIEDFNIICYKGRKHENEIFQEISVLRFRKTNICICCDEKYVSNVKDNRCKRNYISTFDLS